MIEFREFGKIPRLSRPVVITEKIDGTNAQVFIPPLEEAHLYARKVLAGSRTRWIEPGDDNFGFAAWVEKNWEELLQLGPGHHYGEWWGKGIQRNYGLEGRRFSLFNTARWLSCTGTSLAPACCRVVPVLYKGPFSTEAVDGCLGALMSAGSVAAPEFMKPEGVVVYHTASGHLFKQTCEHDDEPKNAHVKKVREPKAPKDPNRGGRRIGCEGYVGSERRISRAIALGF